MGVQESGLTLEGLAKRLEELERENERMRSENAELRQEVVALRGSATPQGEVPALRDSGMPPTTEPAPEPEGPMSRRALLSKAGAAVAGLVVAGALTQTDIREAKAAQISGDSDQPSRGAVEGNNTALFGYGVYGSAADGTGVRGEGGRTGVHGIGTTLYGVQGSGPRGVYGSGSGQAPAGLAGDVGVEGCGATGVWGRTDRTDFSGVYGTHEGTAGYGATGDGKGATCAGVLGRNPQGPGVEGRDSMYGGKFAGSRAQLRLVPAGSAGRPGGAHAKGEVYMDAAANLYVCVRSGTPGTWRKVATTAV